MSLIFADKGKPTLLRTLQKVSRIPFCTNKFEEFKNFLFVCRPNISLFGRFLSGGFWFRVHDCPFQNAPLRVLMIGFSVPLQAYPPQ